MEHRMIFYKFSSFPPDLPDDNRTFMNFMRDEVFPLVHRGPSVWGQVTAHWLLFNFPSDYWWVFDLAVDTVAEATDLVIENAIKNAIDKLTTRGFQMSISDFQVLFRESMLDEKP